MKKAAVGVSQIFCVTTATALSMGYFYYFTSQGVGLYE
jgi:hypothetical protein